MNSNFRLISLVGLPYEVVVGPWKDNMQHLSGSGKEGTYMFRRRRNSTTTKPPNRPRRRLRNTSTLSASARSKAEQRHQASSAQPVARVMEAKAAVSIDALAAEPGCSLDALCII